MEAELVRQTEVLFGEPEGAPDNAPALLHLNMTSRQQRRLWRHVESIENFWENLEETVTR